MSDDKKEDIDEVSGVETMGHEWDGIKELNNPLPRWWVWVWLICCIWAVWYWVVYPAWPVPGGATEGIGGHSQLIELKESQNEILAKQAHYLTKFEKASDQEVLNDPELYSFAVAGGKAAFKDNCATCHGTGGAGGKGYPNLNDDDWLWGGKLEDINLTITHGIRDDEDEDTRTSQMPSFGKDELLNREEIYAVIDYVTALSGGKEKESYTQGAQIFAENCASCHGDNGKGMYDFGAPNLTDKIWLYGGDRKTLYETVYNARAGLMPAWQGRLDGNTIRQLTIYLHQLGGGEDDVEAIAKVVTPAGEKEVVEDEQ